ncbi:MAG TPA: cyclic dehypoxanthinyl futalosine synthase [Bacteroidales bacterium]|nr:cyclic dehypoxanthinyl futalosine synthase [Bacteroidales bacterium]
MHIDQLIQKSLRLEFLTVKQGKELFEKLTLGELMQIAHTLRNLHHPDKEVTWIIDRNMNITNACISGCKFCNFYRPVSNNKVYITSREEYSAKIEALFCIGGNQLLLQGGLHPNLKLDWYEDLFRHLKKQYPKLKLHALGPPEVVHLAKMDQLSFDVVLRRLMDAGLDSLPGAGAEILVDRVRKILSPVKCTAGEWLQVMRDAHQLGLTTSATMMFGHVETLEERLEHLVAIRKVQAEKPSGSKGFLSFIPWPFQDAHTMLRRKKGITNQVTPEEYIRMIAISRIMLPNIPNIQASWLTVGKDTAQLCLHAGANDFGSIMIEENVVSSAGATNSFDAEGIQQAIRDAGFTPRRRDQQFNLVQEEF